MQNSSSCLSKCEGCQFDCQDCRWERESSERTSFCVMNLKPDDCHLASSNVWAIKLRISGECDRLAPMKTCPVCKGSGEEWNPEARFSVSACTTCHGHGEIEFWGNDEEG